MASKLALNRALPGNVSSGTSIDLRGTMNITRHAIAMLAREIVNVIAKTLNVALPIKGVSYHYDDLLA